MIYKMYDIEKIFDIYTIPCNYAPSTVHNFNDTTGSGLPISSATDVANILLRHQEESCHKSTKQ